MRSFSFVRRFTLMLGTVLMLASSIPAAHALTAEGLGIYPTLFDTERPLTKAWFLYNIGPGESVLDTITVANDTAEEKTVVIYPVDSTINNKGGFAIEAERESADQIGAWVLFDWNDEQVRRIELTLDAGEHVEIPFTFAIPADAKLEPGEISGAITMQEKQMSDEERGAGIHIATRVGVRIYNTVPGDITMALALQKYSAKYDPVGDQYLVQAELANQGNVTIMAQLGLYTKQLVWGTTTSSEIRDVRLTPGTTRSVDFTVPRPATGKHGMGVEVTYKNQFDAIQRISSETLTFWAFPWTAIAWIGLLLAINVALICTHIIRKTLAVRSAREYIVQSGDTIEKLAAKFGMTWKQIVRINQLKRPYSLKAKQRLLVIPQKNSKGTKRIALAPARVWATVIIASVVMVGTVGIALWGVTQVGTPTAYFNTALENWSK